MSFRRLPYELVGIIVKQLELEDIYHLSLSCRHFHYLIWEDSICKAVLEATAYASPEAQEARNGGDNGGKHARALRRLFKRRQAIRTPKPFTAAIVAKAVSWLYVNGTLCYILDKALLRVLHLHDSARNEVVVDIRALLDEAIPELRAAKKFKFRVLHYAEGIVSCRYTQFKPTAGSWLVVFDVRRCNVLTAYPLNSTLKLFVRNDANYLYFGTHSEFGADDFRRWVLEGYNIKENKWFDQKVHLLDMVGSDIGSTIAFEIIDGYFYGLSNATSFGVEEVDWTSYYYCFRFPVDRPRAKHTERSIKEQMWRRHHAEGPIDDRWSFIRLQKDERDGTFQILESRKEWLVGQGGGRRCYYTTRVVFPDRVEEETNEDDDEYNTTTTSTTSTTTTSTTTTSSGNGQGPSNYAGHSSEPRPHPRERLRMSPVPPLSTETPLRDPHSTHPGDDASTALLFTLNKCFVRSYHRSCQSFLDLVDDPFPRETDIQRVRLRAGSRQLRPASELARDGTKEVGSLPTKSQIKRLYKNDGDNTIKFWPPHPSDGRPDPAVDDLNAVLNPPSHLGQVKGTWDDRSFVYSTGSSSDGLQALVFISFDPAIHLHGLRQWGDGTRPAQPVDKIARRLRRCEVESAEAKGQGKAVEKEETPHPGVGQFRASAFSTTSTDDSADFRQAFGSSADHISSWAWVEPAMYRSISCGYNFALPRDPFDK